MARIPRYLILVVGSLVLLHLLFSLLHNNYPLNISEAFGDLFDEHISEEHVRESSPQNKSIPKTGGRANATFVMLARNNDVEGAIRSIRSLEDRFNAKHQYPYVLLNEVPFSDDFKRRLSVITPSHIDFGVIPREHWYQPQWIDEEKASKARERMKMENVKYGDSVPYHNMCRYNSGFFYKHELLQKYKWYWRVEPNVKFHCDINQDPFFLMEQNDKIYGFTIATYEISATIPSLWSHVTEFMKAHPEYIAQNNSMEFLSSTHGRTYNRCHFWSNFEIADMDFWRGEAYTAFFEHLDASGNFYYEIPQAQDEWTSFGATASLSGSVAASSTVNLTASVENFRGKNDDRKLFSALGKGKEEQREKTRP
ncbi:glycosyl transferase [Dendrothele bispora CBS 962.96]|uniref:Glycosyl transferase n=1 Tax=Dendrothele bispora (strain CBS 962.96) TaxID=1314807 RepID=A0A4S8LL85_DENBC|nr:glycosyl transferase [Dendrothele bispora CBS 962.96]